MKENEYFCKIFIFNSSKEQPVFSWIRSGNVVLGITVARQYCERKIPHKMENQYSAQIKIKDRADNTMFSWNERQGNVRLSLDVMESFCYDKLGLIPLKDQIKKQKQLPEKTYLLKEQVLT